MKVSGFEMGLKISGELKTNINNNNLTIEN